MAVVDDAGNLQHYARMDRCLRPTFAMRKAYTAAVRGIDTLAFPEQISAQNRSFGSFGGPKLIANPGGVVAMKEGAAGGLTNGIDDESIAKAGFAVLNV